MKLNFTKMHGCGNDYIYMDAMAQDVPNPEKLAVKLSDRHTGIGGDGLILICPSHKADFRMRMFNADGSEGKMCGNGVRCIAKFVYDKGMTDKEEITLETLGGIKILKLKIKEDENSGKNANRGIVESVTVDMGSPVLEGRLIPVNIDKNPVISEKIKVLDREFEMTCVSMGNPHAVVLVDNVKDFPLEIYGPAFESHPLFPERVNTEFVEIIDKETIAMRVWERGSNETLACGTGACACVVAMNLLGIGAPDMTVKLLGGDLWINYDKGSERVIMTGPASTVFEGTVEI